MADQNTKLIWIQWNSTLWDFLDHWLWFWIWIYNLRSRKTLATKFHLNQRIFGFFGEIRVNFTQISSRCYCNETSETTRVPIEILAFYRTLFLTPDLKILNSTERIKYNYRIGNLRYILMLMLDTRFEGQKQSSDNGATI